MIGTGQDKMKEYKIWRDTYEGSFFDEVWAVYKENELYEVSNFGRIRSSVDRVTKGYHKFWKGKIIPQHQQNYTTHTYLRVRMSGTENPVSVHRAVAETFIPNPENKPEVNHIDGNKRNNKVENLEWATEKENKRHAVENNLCTFPTGEHRGDVVYNAEVVEQILDMYYHKLLTPREIGDLLFIHKNYIALVIQGKRWIDVFARFISKDFEYYSEVKMLLTKRRQANRAKIEEEVHAIKRLA